MIVTAGLELILLLQIKSNDESSLLGDKSKNEALLCGGENDDTKTGENERCLPSSVAHRRKNKVHTLDRVFRFLAPAVYVVFCMSYFGYYFGKKYQIY